MKIRWARLHRWIMARQMLAYLIRTLNRLMMKIFRDSTKLQMSQIPRGDKVGRESDGLNEAGSPRWWKILFWTWRGADLSYTKHLLLAGGIRSLCRTAMWQSVVVLMLASFAFVLSFWIYSVISEVSSNVQGVLQRWKFQTKWSRTVRTRGNGMLIALKVCRDRY